LQLKQNGADHVQRKTRTLSLRLEPLPTDNHLIREEQKKNRKKNKSDKDEPAV